MFRIIYNVVSSIFKAYWLLIYSFIISIAIYFMFYLLYLPKPQHIKPIYFSYSSQCEQELGSGYCTFPEATVQLHDSSKAAEDGLRVLSKGQRYNIMLQLEVPMSEQNKALGVFLIQIDLYNKEKELVETSTRPVMFKYENSLLSTISTWFYVFPLLLGWKEQKQQLNIPLLENYIDNSYKPAVSAKIILHSKYVQWYSATLKVSAIFTGIRYYMYNWPITFSLIFFISIFSTVSFMFLWRSLSKTSSDTSGGGLSSFSPYGDLSESSADEDQVEDLIPSGDTTLTSPIRVKRRLKEKEIRTRNEYSSSGTESQNEKAE